MHLMQINLQRTIGQARACQVTAAELHRGEHLYRQSRPLVAASSFLPGFSVATTVG
jgi:hypothetical protein